MHNLFDFRTLLGQLNFRGMKGFNALSISLICFALAACGGGNSNKPVNQSPQGFWQGTSATGNDISAVILENGQYYSIHSQAGTIYGANFGFINAVGNKFSGSLDNIFIPGGQNLTHTATLSGAFNPKSTLQGVAVYSNNIVVSFNATYNSAYDNPASMSAIAGNYVGPYREGETATMNIDIAGNVSGTTTAPGATLPKCLITGSVAPRPSGKNVYDLTLIWNHNPALPQPSCCLGGVCATNTPTTGIALLGLKNSNSIYTAWINAAKSSGLIWTGQKQ